MTEPKKATSPLNSAAGIIGAIGGWSLSHYSGLALWIPGLATIILLVVFQKTKFRPPYFAGAISVTGGHVVWFLAASILMNNWTAAGPDILLLSAAIVWLWLRPGLAATIALGFIQLGSLTYNLTVLLSVPVGSDPHRALTVHCVWRILALICLVSGYLRMRREQTAVPLPVSPPPLC
jgi:hypothetical protein